MSARAEATTAGRPARRRARPAVRRSALATLTVSALGVVFGDIGTSPLYALQSVYALDGGVVRPTPAGVYGVVSLVFWAITLIVSVKYIAFVMRADNDGEGGILALTALAQRATAGVAARGTLLLALGALGASLFYGDSVITPAISVLSAVEGLKVAAPHLPHLAVPLALALLTSCSPCSARAPPPWARVRARDARLVRGDRGDRRPRSGRAPRLIRGLAPTYALEFIFDHPGVAFVAMGAVDAGHHGRGGALRRHGSLRPPADPPGVVLVRVPGPDPELPRAVRARAAPPGRRREPVLPARPGLGAHPDGAAGDRRHVDRLPGRDLRGVLTLTPGHAARLPASPPDPPHLLTDRGPDLRAGRQLDALRRRRRGRRRLRLLRAAEQRLRRSPSAAPSSSRRCCSSSSRVCAGTGGGGSSRRSLACSCRWRPSSWPRTSARSRTAAGCRSPSPPPSTRS